MAHESKIDAIVTQALEAFNVPGAAVAVVVDDKIVHCQSYGMRDLENGLPVTENTVFPIASNTKAFTSFLISQLVEEGKLAWDDPVIKYLPQFRLHNHALSSQVTLRDLIAHRTGIPRHDVLWYAVRDLSEEDVLDALPHFPPVSRLRESFLYNNFMYVVAGMVINKVTKSTWEEEIRLRILEPLRMSHTGTSNQFQEIADAAQPYAEIGGKIQKLSFLYPYSTLAASAIHSTISDMAKWLQVQLRSKNQPYFIQKETLEEMHTIHMSFNTRLFELSGYGLGWEIDVYKQRKQVHHGGTLEGFFSEVSFLPNEKIGVVILTNSSTDGRYAISSIKNSIYDLVLGIQDTNWICKFLEERSIIKQESQFPSLLIYEGRYVHPAYGTMEILLEYDSLVATLGKMKVPLIQKSEGVFVAKYQALLAYGVNPIIEFSFFSNSLGEVDELHIPFEHFRSAPPVIFKK